MSVQLIIKSAAQSVEDFKLDCELSWTIAQVKDQITALYPTKPIREHQKLIYSGKLLPDDLCLTSVLNQSQDVHTVHLVCPFVPSMNSKSTDTREVLTEPAPISPVNAQASANFQTFNSGISVMPSLSADMQQYLMAQQMYSHFMAQYLSQFNGQIPQNTHPTPMVQNVTNQPVPVQNRAVPRRPAEENPDYLEYLYIFGRAMAMFAILFHYSSPQRILVVMLMCLLAFICKKMNQENQVLIQQRAQQTTEDHHADIQPSTTEEQVPENSAAVPESNSRSSTLMTLLTLVSSFFSSLIPTDTVPVNIN